MMLIKNGRRFKMVKIGRPFLDLIDVYIKETNILLDDSMKMVNKRNSRSQFGAVCNLNTILKLRALLSQK